ncbi:MAG: hypoxanthine phosphoribosyltransferase [candidate division Zixibacteria bacterium]|nr:hypoxanthine phosphoribosyltransferase [candidate division Zixibacteria bacterium]MCI0597088.1 hypoxanthine phosphoribosyltransferase [candidate division Zixibacteria bacterium]
MKDELIPFLSASQIQKKVAELARKISRDYDGKKPVLVGVLKGSFVFLSDLSRKLSIPHEVDFLETESYGPSTLTSGVVRLLKDLRSEITGRQVLLVEDIVDSGLTLSYLERSLLAKKPKGLAVATLLERKHPKRVKVSVRYRGFWVPGGFVVGYGLDYNEKYRHLPGLAFLAKSLNPSKKQA